MGEYSAIIVAVILSLIFIFTGRLVDIIAAVVVIVIVKVIGFNTWYALAAAVLNCSIWNIDWGKNRREAKRKAAELEKEAIAAKRKEELEEQRVLLEQESVIKELIDIHYWALEQYHYLPYIFLEAEKHLDKAEVEFKQNAFAPFWSSIELALDQLGNFSQAVLKITQWSKRHEMLINSYAGDTFNFPINLKSVKAMSVSSIITNRLESIVRKAQTNFEFSMIFEQRRTNKLLHTGFANLAQAVDGMGRQIALSIDYLDDHVSSMSSTIDKSLNNISEGIENFNVSLKDANVTMKNYISENANRDSEASKRHEEALLMLDNIQRRRKPLISEYRDGGY